jgi:hypothetical protein
LATEIRLAIMFTYADDNRMTEAVAELGGLKDYSDKKRKELQARKEALRKMLKVKFI